MPSCAVTLDEQVDVDSLAVRLWAGHREQVSLAAWIDRRRIASSCSTVSMPSAMTEAFDGPRCSGSFSTAIAGSRRTPPWTRDRSIFTMSNTISLSRRSPAFRPRRRQRRSGIRHRGTGRGWPAVLHVLDRLALVSSRTIRSGSSRADGGGHEVATGNRSPATAARLHAQVSSGKAVAHPGDDRLDRQHVELDRAFSDLCGREQRTGIKELRACQGPTRPSNPTTSPEVRSKIG